MNDDPTRAILLEGVRFDLVFPMRFWDEFFKFAGRRGVQVNRSGALVDECYRASSTHARMIGFAESEAVPALKEFCSRFLTEKD